MRTMSSIYKTMMFYKSETIVSIMDNKTEINVSRNILIWCIADI